MNDELNRGVLFRNKEKKTDKHPDYSGSITLEDGEHWLNAWINESKKGTMYMSLRVGDLKEQQQQKEPAPGGDFSDDIPF